MTEIPEHLLRRSRERREALGLAKPGEGGAAPAEAAATPATGTEVEPAAAAAAAPAPAPARAPAPAPAAPPPPKPDPPYVAAAKNRRKIPWWAMPVVAGLPVWAGLYAWTLEAPSEGETDPLVLGQELYEGTCASCHTANGGGQAAGGTAPVDFREGALIETWPNWRNHVAWVTLGSEGWPGGTYGAQETPIRGAMPPHESVFTPEEIALIVRYEREKLAGLDPEEEPDLVAITDAIGLGESTTEDGQNIEEVLTEAQEPGDGPGGTSDEPPPE